MEAALEARIIEHPKVTGSSYGYRDILLKPVAIIIIHVSACLMYAYNFVVFLG